MLVVEQQELVVVLVEQLRCMNIGIPERYWEFRMKDLEKTFTKNNALSIGSFKLWLEYMPMAFEDGNGLLLWSEHHGSAKTALASVAARKAFMLKKRVAWVDGETLLNVLLGEHNAALSVIGGLSNVDALVIDEIDKIHVSASDTSYSSNLVSGYFNEIWNRKIVVIATSNKPLSGLKSVLPAAAVDRISSWDDLEFKGSGYRGKQSTLRKMITRKEKDLAK